MTPQPSPRLFGITAVHADIVVIIRRGPSDWCQLGRWDAAQRSYEEGSWLQGKLFPQRCDVSPDGRWLCYMAFKGNNRQALGASYIAISRVPWLHALAAWPLEDTWSRGYHFVEDRDVWAAAEPHQGSVQAFRAKLGLAHTTPAQFAVERRRGWVEAPSSPPRAPDDVWDERRVAIMQKPQPGKRRPLLLTVQGKYAGFRERPPSDLQYSLSDGKATHALPEVQWADWSRAGELLVATHGGTLQQLRCNGPEDRRVVFEQDLTHSTPDPRAPPIAARQW